MAISTQSVANSGVSQDAGRTLASTRSASLSYADALQAAAIQIEVSALAITTLTSADLSFAAAAVSHPAPDAQATAAVYPASATSSLPLIVPANGVATAVSSATADVLVAAPIGSATAAGFFRASGVMQGLLVEAVSQALSTVTTDPTYAAAAAAHYASIGAMHFPSNDSQYPLPRVRSQLIPPVMPTRDSKELAAS